ncbi:MAG TPA: hypothetical protein VGU73_07190, partial [Acidimicrobiia bacterium]|nr:hypothetical protein [Acidimicrobiia bacterium]
DRGWSRAMVRDLLGEEDQRRRNPWYRNAAPVRLWSWKRVLAAEASGDFAARREAVARRQQAAREAARARAERLRRWAETVAISVDRMPVGVAMARATESYNRWHYDGDAAGPWSDDAFLTRITVNFLRHESTPYDEEMAACRGLPGVRRAQAILRARVLKAIGDAYPALAKECERQRIGPRP